MAQIYDHKSEELHSLLDKAANQQGATLVIPDLQRPYVWTPNQVSLLVDSLIRGWPFGTLLLWKVDHDEKHSIPSRAFWTIVDRTVNEGGQALLQGQPPAEYQMVLDGQQRVQSLLLATHGDNWGFKLPDKDWGVETGSKSAKGKTNKQHWSLGSLCLDLDAFLTAYSEANEQISALEFERVLVWAVTDENEGKSKAKTNQSYKRPLVDRFAKENKGNLIRFSRLWTLAGSNLNFKEKNYHPLIEGLLNAHGVANEKWDELRAPLAELMTTLRDIKLQKVAFLELRAFDAATMDRADYDDAIVNIFTRLNTAGRTLSREEITFAWLKVGWQPARTGDRSAQECFQDLRADLKSQGLMLSTDELVAVVSFLWAVAHNGGNTLSNRDLLQGDIIRPMAASLSAEWDRLAQAITGIATIIKDRGLSGGKIYTSVNALAVICSAHFEHHRHALDLAKGHLETESAEKAGMELADQYIDRWFAGSTWAQKWARSSSKVLSSYAASLKDDVALYAKAETVNACEGIYKTRLDALVASIQQDAESHINDRLGAETREQVSQYFGPLWLWHRLEKDRWEASQTPLKIGKAKTDLDVDHIVSVKIWKNREIPDDLVAEGESVDAIINSLGNCVLLEKSFNIVKSGDSLRMFMKKVHKFKDDHAQIPPWATKLGIAEGLLDGDTADLKQIASDIQFRDESIRKDLIRFIRGEVQRVDV